MMVTAERGLMEWRAALLIGGYDVGLAIEEKLDTLAVALVGCQMKRRTRSFFLAIDVCLMIEKQHETLEVSSAGRMV